MIQNIDASKCTGCGICVDACPLDTLRLNPYTKGIAPCRQACPAGIDIRGFIYYIKQDMIEESARLMEQSLPYPSITGRLCTHPCEKACARGKVDDPLNIRTLERYVGDYQLEWLPERLPVRHASKVAIIGSGPVGLASAYYLCRMGYITTVFEKEDQIGGSFLKEVKNGQLKGEILDCEIDRLKKMGVTFTANVYFSKSLGLAELMDMRYDAIFLALGIVSDFLSLNPYINAQGVFHEKDLLTKEMPLIKAIAIAKGSASRINRYLQGKDSVEKVRTKYKKASNIPKIGIKPNPRHEVENGFDENTVVTEALRCMTCGSLAYIAYPEDCMTCYDCEVKCPVGAIKVHPFKEVLPLSLPMDD